MRRYKKKSRARIAKEALTWILLGLMIAVILWFLVHGLMDCSGSGARLDPG
jgi:hypothetical protein